MRERGWKRSPRGLSGEASGLTPTLNLTSAPVAVACASRRVSRRRLSRTGVALTEASLSPPPGNGRPLKQTMKATFSASFIVSLTALARRTGLEGFPLYCGVYGYDFVDTLEKRFLKASHFIGHWLKRLGFRKMSHISVETVFCCFGGQC